MERITGEKKIVGEIAVYKRRRNDTNAGKSVFFPSEKNSTKESYPRGKKSSGSDVAKTDDKDQIIGDDGSYFFCVLCDEGGKLLCCDFCPRTFHLSCLNYKSVPKGIWKCPNCRADKDLSNGLIKNLKKSASKKSIPPKKKGASRSSNSKNK